MYAKKRNFVYTVYMKMQNFVYNALQLAPNKKVWKTEHESAANAVRRALRRSMRQFKREP